MKRILLPLLAALALGATHPVAAGVYEEILMAANQAETGKVIDLLRRGMDVNTADKEGTTLLMIAARTNNAELVRFLLDNRVNTQRRNRFGDTALMLASLHGHVETARLMLERKVDPNIAGWAPLHYAAFENRHEIVSLLIAAGAEINARAPNGWTALMLAAQRGHSETVRLLVGSGADIQVADAEKGDALALARAAGHDQIVRFMEQAKAEGVR